MPETLGSLNLGAHYTDRDTEAQTRDRIPWGHTASQRLSWVSDMLQAETQFPTDEIVLVLLALVLSGRREAGSPGLEKWDAQARALQAGGLDQSHCPWWASVYKSVQWADAVRGAEAG